jgi:metal-sulfur cluster biosynthetic enzyme
MAGVFLNEVERRLRSLPQIDQVEASIDSSTMWRPELMTPEYRVQLAAVRRERIPAAAVLGENS